MYENRSHLATNQYMHYSETVRPPGYFQQLPGPLDDVSLDGSFRVKSVQSLPVPGKLGVSSGASRSGSQEDQRQNHQCHNLTD